MYRHIVLAYDGSPEGQEALKQGIYLASLCGAQVFLLAVINPSEDILAAGGMPYLIEQQELEIEATLQAGLARMRERGLTAKAEVGYGKPAEQIALLARKVDADLIVIGHRDQKVWARWWNGSVGASILVHAPCSLLVAISSGFHGQGPDGGIGVGAANKHDRRRSAEVVALPLGRRASSDAA